jgi:hypothetical protein
VKVDAVDAGQRKLSLSLAEISRAEAEEAATIKEYNQQSKEAPQNMGSLGDILKVKMDQEEKK